MKGTRKPGEPMYQFIGKNCLTGVLAASFAECCTIPIDTAKVILQL